MAKGKKGKGNAKAAKPGSPPGLGSLRREVMRNLALAHESMLGELSALLRSRGLSESSHDLLYVLKQADPEGLPTLELAGRMMHRGPDITRLSTRLERMKLVRRLRSAEDRRVVRVSLTDLGAAVVDELEKPLKRLRRELLGHLSPKDLSRLSGLLSEARNGLGEQVKKEAQAPKGSKPL